MKKLKFGVISKVLLFVALNVFAACIAIFIYIKWMEYTEQNVIKDLADYKIIRKIFLKDEFVNLIRIITNNRSQKFTVVQDFDNAVLLSKDLYSAQEMFGFTKYKYHPNIAVYNLRVWNGLRGRRLVLAATPELKTALTKNKVFTKVYFQTDSFGFKKTEFKWTPNSVPIFFLGDSFTEGLFVAPKETFVSLVGTKLMRAVPSIVPINLGVDGYSALEQDWMLEHYAPILHPKIAVASLFPNDVHIDFLKVLQGEGIPDSNYATMFYYLQRMKDFCERGGITLVIAVIPAKEQFNELRGFSAFPDRVEEWCKRQGVLYLDPRNFFEKHDVDNIYFSWDAHFSPPGHDIYAEFLSQNLAPLILSKDTVKTEFSLRN